VGIPVFVKRHHHGWHRFRLEATITGREQRATGSYRYEVTTPDGEVYEVDHTRDLIPKNQQLGR
jgi:hypothetical protein